MRNRRDITNNFSAKRIALSGILIALTVITLLFASVMPTGRLSLYALSSFFVSIIIVEYGVKWGWAFFAASSLAALAVIPVKIRTVPYIIFFGVYGIIKLYIEKLNNIVLEYILKLLYFNLCLAASVYLFKELFIQGAWTDLDFPWWIIVAGLEIIFLIYDYVYTLFIQYYRMRLKRIIKL